MVYNRAVLLSRTTSFIVIAQLLLLGIDAYGNNMKSFELLHVVSGSLIIPILLAQFVLNTMGASKQSERLINFLSWIVLPLLLLGTVILSVLDSATHANAVYNWTHLHQSKLGAMTIFLALSLAISESRSWAKHQHWRFTRFLPYYSFVVLFLVSLWPFDFFIILGREDGLIENLQVVALILASLWCGRWALRLRSLALFIFSLGFFFVAGDELAWGQRIFSPALPSFFETYNRQKEITAHNIAAIEWSVQWIYLTISFVGVFGRQIIKRLYRPINKLHAWLPTGSFAGYFIFPLIFYFAQRIVEGGIWHNWVEPMELFIYVGVILWISLRLTHRS